MREKLNKIFNSIAVQASQSFTKEQKDFIHSVLEGAFNEFELLHGTREARNHDIKPNSFNTNAINTKSSYEIKSIFPEQKDK